MISRGIFLARFTVSMDKFAGPRLALKTLCEVYAWSSSYPTEENTGIN